MTEPKPQSPAPAVRPTFDPDLSPHSEHNRRAAAAHGLRYDPGKQAYIDSDGALVRDQFGQRY